MSVSYTHLDVYKRQGEGGAVGVLCYAGAAAGVHGDGGVREGGAEEQRIGEERILLINWSSGTRL